jgi:hypothetical protein
MPLAKNRTSDPDMRGAHLDSGVEIRAHPHRQGFDAVALGYFAEQGKMRRWWLIHWRDAHQPFNR